MDGMATNMATATITVVVRAEALVTAIVDGNDHGDGYDNGAADDDDDVGKQYKEDDAEGSNMGDRDGEAVAILHVADAATT